MSVSVDSVMVTAGDGRQLQVLTTTGTDTPTVVLHMGTPAGLAQLPAQLVHDARCGIVTYARPGYGQSTPQPSRAVAEAAQDTATVLDALGIDHFVTAGWSGGSPHALACAALLPDRCRATASIAGFAPAAASIQDWTGTKLDLAQRGDHEGLAAAVEADQAGSATFARVDMAPMFSAEPDRAALTGEYAEWLAAVIRAAYATGVAGVRDDWIALAGEWGFQWSDADNVAVWHGDRDDVVTLANASWLAEQIPNALLRVLPGEGHISIGLAIPEIFEDLLSRVG